MVEKGIAERLPTPLHVREIALLRKCIIPALKIFNGEFLFHHLPLVLELIQVRLARWIHRSITTPASTTPTKHFVRH